MQENCVDLDINVPFGMGKFIQAIMADFKWRYEEGRKRSLAIPTNLAFTFLAMKVLSGHLNCSL